MGEQVNELIMNADLADMSSSNLDPEAERLFRKQRLAAALRFSASLALMRASPAILR